jgi:hypothetical protein
VIFCAHEHELTPPRSNFGSCTAVHVLLWTRTVYGWARAAVTHTTGLRAIAGTVGIETQNYALICTLSLEGAADAPTARTQHSTVSMTKRSDQPPGDTGMSRKGARSRANDASGASDWKL